MKKHYLIWLLLLAKTAYAVPSATILPSIGPIIAQIVLVLVSGALLFLSKIRKYHRILLIAGMLLLLAAVALIIADLR